MANYIWDFNAPSGQRLVARDSYVTRKDILKRQGEYLVDTALAEKERRENLSEELAKKQTVAPSGTGGVADFRQIDQTSGKLPAQQSTSNIPASILKTEEVSGVDEILRGTGASQPGISVPKNMFKGIGITNVQNTPGQGFLKDLNIFLDKSSDVASFGLTNLAEKATDTLFDKIGLPAVPKELITEPTNESEQRWATAGQIAGTAAALPVGLKGAGTVGKKVAGPVASALKSLVTKTPTPVKAGLGLGAAATAVETGRGAFGPEYADRRKTFPSQFGASVRGGVGDTVGLLGSAAEWKDMPELAEKLKQTGSNISEGYDSEPVPFTWKSFFDPDWYANNVARTIPTTAALIPPMFVSYKLGKGVAGKLGFSKFWQTVVGSLSGSAASRPLESAMEAGGAYEEALAMGKSEQEANYAAQKVYEANLKLMGLDAVQLAAAFVPAGKIAGRLGKGGMAAARLGAGIGTETVEEGYQTVVQQQALGTDTRGAWQQFLDPTVEMQESMAIGGLFGAGMGGVGVVNDMYTNIKARTIAELPDEVMPEVQSRVEEHISEGMTPPEAVDSVLDEMAEVPEGAEVINRITQEEAQKTLAQLPQQEIAPAAEVGTDTSAPVETAQPVQVSQEQTPAVESGNVVVHNKTGETLQIIDQTNPEFVVVQNENGQVFGLSVDEISVQPQALEAGQAQTGEMSVVDVTVPELGQNAPQGQIGADAGKGVVPEQAHVQSDAVTGIEDSSAEKPSRIEGKTSTAKTERGTSVDVQYAVVDAEDLIASHSTELKTNESYPQELQPRDRGRVASELQVSRIANNLEPEFLGESPKASEGAPIVGPDMVVESGNGRVIALKRVYESSSENAEKYSQWLASNADRFGVDRETISQVKSPVLVRIRTGEVDRSSFVKEANEQSTAAMSATEQGKADAEKLTPEMMSIFVPSEDGGILNKDNRSFVREFMGKVIGASEQGRYATSDGSISQEGVSRIRNAVFAKAYENSEALEKLAESTDNNVKNITNAMLMAAPKMAALRNGIEEGNFYPLDITAEVAAATNKLSQLREQGMDVSDYLSLENQENLFGVKEMDLLAKDILQVFNQHKRSGKKIAKILNDYVDGVVAVGSPEQGSLWGETPPPTKAEVLDASLRRMEEGNEQASLFGDQAGRSQADRKTYGGTGEKTGAVSKSQREEKEGLSDNDILKENGITYNEGKLLREDENNDEGKRRLKESLEQLVAAEKRPISNMRRTRLDRAGRTKETATDAEIVEEGRQKTRIGKPPRRIEKEQSGRVLSNIPRSAKSDSGIRTLALGITKAAAKTGRIDLRGARVSNPQELATLAQVFRNPSYETFRIFYVKGDEIVAHEGITSRLPGASSIFVEDKARDWNKMKRRMERLGADGYYLVHNHPSGYSTPSKEDVTVSLTMSDEVQGFKGHVVIDSNEYSFISPISGMVTTKSVDFSKGESDAILTPSIEHPLLGQKITSDYLLAQIGKSIQVSKNMSVIIYTDASGAVRAIQEVPEGLFNSLDHATDYIRGRTREFGGRNTFLVTQNSRLYNRKGFELVKQGILTDAVYLRGAASYETSRADNSSVDRLRAQNSRGKWMGRKVPRQGQRVEEPEASREQVAPIFYSQLRRVIEQKMPNKAAPNQVLSIVKGGQVKAEEVKWSGIEEWLKEQAGKVSKEDVLAFIDANDVQIQEVEPGSQTYDKYQLPGGENYQELLFTLPRNDSLPPGWKIEEHPEYGWMITGSRGEVVQGETQQEVIANARQYFAKDSSDYRSSHWYEPNVLAHVRFNDRTGADGEKIVLVEEIQSDWHQEGRQKGYKEKGKDDIGVPDAPFKTTWQELAFKRMIRYAAENGYDRIAWTTGEQQAERYDLSKKVKYIGWIKHSNGKYHVTVKDLELNLIYNEREKTIDDIEKFAGKEIARKIQSSTENNGVIEGDNLKVGGSGMKVFYNQMLPAFLNKYVKKWGAKVEPATIGGEVGTVQSVPITNAMKKSVLYDGQPKFKFADDVAELNEALGADKFNLKYAPEAMEREDMQAADIIARLISDSQVVPFTGTESPQGVAFGQNIFLNEKTKAPHMYVAKHEMVHMLGETDPEALSELMDIAHKYALSDPRIQEKVKDHYLSKGYEMEEVWEEFTADITSEVMEEPGFWQKVREQSPELFKAVIDIIDEIISQFKKAVAGQESMLKYVKDLENFKSEVAGTMARSLQRRPRNLFDLRQADEFAAKTRAKQKQDKAPAKGASLFDGIGGRAKAKMSTVDPTETTEFKKWFGDSKVVGKDGKPLAVYHGTASDFSVFEKSKALDKEGRKLGMGWGKGKFYFTSSPEGAGGAASGAEYFGRGKRQNIMPVYLSVKKSVSADEYMKLVTQKIQTGISRDAAIAQVDKHLKGQGYDGIVDLNNSGSVAVFEPTQVKSVYNRGTWDASSPDIRMKLKQSEKQEPKLNAADAKLRDEVDEINRQSMMDFFEKMVDEFKLKSTPEQLYEKVFKDNMLREERERIMRNTLLDRYTDWQEIDSRQLDEKKAEVQGYAGARALKPGGKRDKTGSLSPASRKEIVDFLSEKLDIPIRVGRYNKRSALGVFKTRSEVIRTKLAQDIEVIAHEIGHYLDKRLGLQSNKYDDEMKTLAEGIKGPIRSEGVAQFVNFWLTDPDKAKRLAPRYFEDFQAKLDENPEVADVLETAQKQIDTWLKQPATARVLGQLSVGEGTLKRPMTFDRIYTAAVDELRPLQQAVKTITQGHKVDDMVNPYLTAWAARGWNGKAEAAIHYGQFDKNLKKAGPSLNEILKKVDKQLNEFRAFITAKRTLELSERDINSGITVEDAKEVVASFDAETTSLFEETLKELVGFQDYIMNQAVESGLVSKDALASMRELNRNYVPFYRLFDEGMQQQGFAGKTFANLASPIKSIKGSERTIIDPIESIIKNTYTLINLSERQHVGRQLADLAARFEGSGKVIEKIATPMVPHNFQLKQLEGLLNAEGIDTGAIDLEKVATIFKPNYLAPKGKENILTVFKDGKPEFYQVEPELYRAMLFLDRESSNILDKLLTYPTSLLRAGATLTPEFIARNPVRDQFSAFINSKYGFIPGVDLIRGLAHVIKKDEVYWQWYQSGGAHGSFVSVDRDYLQKDMRKLLRRELKEKFVDTLTHPIEILRTLSEYTEEATRVMEFKKGLRKEGPERARMAAIASRDITLDFSRAGYTGKAMNRWIAFFNAGIQSEDKMIRQFDPRNAKRAAMSTFKAVVSITLPSVLLFFLNKDNEYYKEIPRWEKDIFWLIPYNGGKNFARIPKPFELGVIFGTIPERFLEYAYSKDSSAFDEMGETVKRYVFLDLVPDKDYMGLPPGLMPTALLPIIECWANKSSFTEYQIVPRREEGLEPGLQYGPYTSESAKIIGKAVGISPRKVDQLIYGYTAGLGRNVSAGVDWVLEKAGLAQRTPKPEGKLADIPMIKAFISTNPKSGQSISVDRFYKDYNDAEVLYKSLKTRIDNGENISAGSLTKRETALLVNRKALGRVADDLGDLRKVQRQVLGAKDISPDDKREMLHKLDVGMINTVRAAYGQPFLEY